MGDSVFVKGKVFSCFVASDKCVPMSFKEFDWAIGDLGSVWVLLCEVVSSARSLDDPVDGLSEEVLG